MALRNNKKRAFLFVSKWLGKHIPVHPKKSLFIGALLAYEHQRQRQNIEITEKEQKHIQSILINPNSFNENEWIYQTVEPLTIIGFAETATGLGYSLFRCFPNSQFFHTTREEVVHKKATITFEEEHSHATSHRGYVEETFLNHKNEVVLVDDELTTGKTVLNIIRSMQDQFPREKYTVVSILDWRSTEDRIRFKQLEKECNCEIQVVSLIRGTISLQQNQEFKLHSSDSLVKDYEVSSPKIIWKRLSDKVKPPFAVIDHYSKTTNQELYEVPFLKETGRFGLSGIELPQVESWIKNLADQLVLTRSGKKLLCLGSGEFMYLPMLLATHLGAGVYYQSTTRSPIHVKESVGYAVTRGSQFPAPIDERIQHFVYNIIENKYDEIWVFFERKPKSYHIERMCEALSYTRVKKISILHFL